MKRKTTWNDEEETEDMIIQSGIEVDTYTKEEQFVMENITQLQAENIFDISLDGRTFTIEFNPRDVAITFVNNGGTFGYIERLKTNEFWNKYKSICQK